MRPELASEHEGDFVVIDVESGDYEISKNEDEAFARAERSHPGALFFFARASRAWGPEDSSYPPTA